jgi:hypothetical protein
MSRIDPWSVMKTAFLLSIAFGIVTWVAVFIIWSAIGAAGVFDNINSTVQEVLGTPTAEPFRIENYVNTGKVMGFTTLLACADVLIITALATLGSFLYNIAATLLGGLEVTLASAKRLKLTQLAQSTLPVGSLRVNLIDTATHVVPTAEPSLKG